MEVANTRGFVPPDGYQLLARLSEGGMGTVFLGFRKTTNPARIPVAFKLIHEHLCRDPKVRYMLEREHQLARAVSHPNVLEVTDFGEHEGRLYIAMPYVEGATINELLRVNNRQLPIAATISLVIDALAGLQAIHSAVDLRGEALGIVHRDVSPANILVGTDGRARMIDFGVATLATSDRTQPGSMRGHIGYIAPEVIRGEPLDSRGDLFAVGVVLYYALTGVHPFRGATEAETMVRVLSGSLAPPSTVGSQPPAAMDEVCQKALKLDPTQRFQTAAEMAEALAVLQTTSGAQTSHGQIGEWVDTSFRDRIESRRHLLSINGVLPAYVEKPSSRDDISTWPPIEPMPPEPRASTRESWPKAPPPPANFAGITGPITSTTGPSALVAGQNPSVEMVTLSKKRSWMKSVLLGALVILVGVVGGVVGSMRSGQNSASDNSRPQAGEPTAEAPRTIPAAAATQPVPTASKPVDVGSAEEPPKPVEPTPKAAPPPRRKRGGIVRRRKRPGPVQPKPPPTVKTDEAASGGDDSAAAAGAAAEANPDDDKPKADKESVEKNPYKADGLENNPYKKRDSVEKNPYGN